MKLFKTNPERLSDLWWVLNRNGLPHRYTAPMAMTLEMWRQRFCGRNVYWKAPTVAASGKWSEPACVIDRTLRRNRFGDLVPLSSEIRVKRTAFWWWLVNKECDFWNGRGLRLRRPVRGHFD